MMKKIAELCQKKKVFCQVSMEKYFKCGGMGLCGECSCKGKLVCTDGPVFSGKILIENN
jgi:dihydroorotate dehydrogenase electron transfer subunit